jgi:LPS-assembly lipoprotein
MRAVFTLALALLLAACGFQLRGTAQLPFDTLYMPPTTVPGVALDLKRNIQSGTNTKVIDDPQKADAVLEFLQETREKHILSLAATGACANSNCATASTFRVHDGKGGEFLPASTVQLTRDISFDDRSRAREGNRGAAAVPRHAVRHGAADHAAPRRGAAAEARRVVGART